MKKIPLTQGKFALVDDEDYEFLMQWKWHYTGRVAKRSKCHGVQQMHRLIMNTNNGFEVDHINHDTLDNQKNNLRNVTRKQNCMNKGAEKNSTSKYVGVSWCTKRKKWVSNIMINGIQKNLGRFSCEKKAAIAYNEKAVKLFGEFACLNQF